jgi:hypothetical protein
MELAKTFDASALGKPFSGHVPGPVQDLHVTCTRCGRSFTVVAAMMAALGGSPVPYCLVAAEEAIDRAVKQRDALLAEGEALAWKSRSWWRSRKSREEYQVQALRKDGEANEVSERIRQMRQRVEFIRQTQDNQNWVPQPKPNDPITTVKAIEQAKEFSFVASLIHAGQSLLEYEEEEIQRLTSFIATAKAKGEEFGAAQARLDELRSHPEHHKR